MIDITVEMTTPNRPDVITMINELDHYLGQLYPAESNHLLDISALMQPNIRFLVASHQNETVGCGAIRVQEDYAEIKRMYVKPSARGKGIASRVLDHLEMLARESGINTLRLETGISQPEALALYERRGYTRCAPFGDYTHDPLSLFYEKRLDA